MKNTGTFPLISLFFLIVFMLKAAEAKQSIGTDDPTQVKLNLECMQISHLCIHQQGKTKSGNNQVKESNQGSIDNNDQKQSGIQRLKTEPEIDAQKKETNVESSKDDFGRQTLMIFFQKLQKVFYYSTGLVTGS